jgi:peptidyl-prolyl cis-trans isomerase B (cyclophilin B)
VLLLSSCEETPYLDYDYTITYETFGGTQIESIEVKLEGEINEPVVPIKENYIFEGWYSDEKLTSTFDFPSVAYSDITLYSKWSYDGIVEQDSDIDLSELPYSEYLNESNPVITIVVSGIGIMKLELFPSVAPNTVNNFIMYIQNGDFTNNTFHRVIEDFMIQGGNTNSTICSINGDFELNGFTNDLSHSRGVLSMARTSIMNSATSQFFIMHADYPFLDGSYASFGGLIEGFNVLDYIAVVETGVYDAPVEDIIIESISVELNGYDAEEPVCAN